MFPPTTDTLPEAPAAVDPVTGATAEPATDSTKQWKARIDRSKRTRRDMMSEWSTNVDFRRGKQFDGESDDDRIAVNRDWPLTKSKHASLFSQVPAVTATSDFKRFQPIAQLWALALNKRIVKSKVDVALDEVLPDVINAAGIGACLVSFQSRSEKRTIPTVEPEVAAQLTEIGVEVPSEEVDHQTDYRFECTRISPGDLLRPDEFVGSDFDQAAWLGKSGRMPWALAQPEFELTDDQKIDVCKGDTRGTQDRLSDAGTPETDVDSDIVSYDEIYYWDHAFNPLQPSFSCIKRIVFVDGIDEPVSDEPWKGQRHNPTTGKYLGAQKLPIRVLTLTYVSDQAVPPSDTSVGRPQVNELIRGRTDTVMQRFRSRPIRYYDPNRVDPAVGETLMRGTWQGLIPIAGNGQNAIGEVARAVYPPENFEYDRIANADLERTWGIGSNQMGNFASGERSAAEANIVNSAFQAQAGQERGRVSKFFLGIVDVLSGLMSLYDTFEDLLELEQVQVLSQVWDRENVNPDFAFTIRPDSTVVLDAEQRIERLLRALNLVGKSPFVNPKDIITEIITLSGIDPTAVIVDPPPPSPEPAKVSVSSAEDLNNVLFLALLFQSGQGPTPENLEAAKKALMAAQMPPPMPEGTQMGPNGPIAPPEGLDGPPPPAGPPPAGPPDTEDWEAMPRITKRPEEMGG